MPRNYEIVALNFYTLPTISYILAPMSKIRFDYVELKAVKTDEGYLKDSPIVARTGILTYRNDDGSIRKELRRPEQVFNADSLASFSGKPITVDHPKGLVNHENIEQYQVGTMLAPGRQDGENVRADVMIHKPSKIGERRQLSLGYDVDLLETPGEYNGERYDAEQTNIRVNHLSIVKNARAGAQARLNLDSNEEPLNLPEPVDMPKIRLDNDVEYEAPQEVVNAIVKMRADALAVTTELNTTKTTVQTLTGERDTLKARVDSFPAELEAAKTAAQTSAQAAITERVKLEKIAADFKVDSKDKTNDEVKHLVIKVFNKDFDPKDKSADYVNAAFDIAAASRKDEAIKNQRRIVNGQLEGSRNDADENDPRDAYKASLGHNAVKAKE